MFLQLQGKFKLLDKQFHDNFVENRVHNICTNKSSKLINLKISILFLKLTKLTSLENKKTYRWPTIWWTSSHSNLGIFIFTLVRLIVVEWSSLEVMETKTRTKFILMHIQDASFSTSLHECFHPIPFYRPLEQKDTFRCKILQRQKAECAFLSIAFHSGCRETGWKNMQCLNCTAVSLLFQGRTKNFAYSHVPDLCVLLLTLSKFLFFR